MRMDDDFRHSFKCNATTWPPQAFRGIVASNTVSVRATIILNGID